MEEAKHSSVTGSGGQELILVREFDAPRDLVFKAWTEPERLTHWWGPKGFSWKTGTMDLRPGGKFHYCMESPAGSEMWGKFVYREVTPPERLVFVVSFSDKDGNTLRHPLSETWPLELLNTITFTEHEGKTTLEMKAIPINASEVEFNTFIAAQQAVQQGFNATIDQLVEYLSSVVKG